MITCTCTICGKNIQKHPSQIKNCINLYCGRDCANKGLIGRKVYRKNNSCLKQNDQLKNLTLIQYTLKDKRKAWKCKCSCGNTVIRREDYLQRLIKEDRTISCGCKNPISKKGSESEKWKGVGKLSAQYFQSIKRRAIKKEILFDITIEYIWNLYLEQNRKCIISGIDITMAESRRTEEEMTASLDRKDSSMGYIEGNVQWVHKTVNKMKNDSSDKEFIEWCQIIAAKSLSE